MRTRVVLLSLGLLLAVMAVRAAQEDAGDDIDVKRLLVEPDRLAAEIERARLGVLKTLPQAEFEEQLRAYRAARKAALTLTAPQLIKARYLRLRLHEDPSGRGEPYLAGSGEWTVRHSGSGVAVLPLQPLTLALNRVRYENRSALVGDFDREQPGLLVDKPGTHTVLFDWTARGEPTPDGVLFELRVPSAALAQLELDLPSERTLTVEPEGCLLETSKSDLNNHQLWRVNFAGRSSLFLTVSPATRPAVPVGLMVAEQVSRHQIAPEGVTSEFSFDLRIGVRGLTTLTFGCDPLLKPYQIGLAAGDTARLDRPEFRVNALPGGRSELKLVFREPLAGTVKPRLYFRAPHLLPKPDGRTPSAALPWVCPRVDLQPGHQSPHAESIQIGVQPQVRLEQWQSGDFRITAPTGADGTRGVTLVSSGFPVGTPLRPRALLRLHGADYHARALSWWRLGTERPRLDVQITFDVRHGRVLEVPLWVPAGWDVERVSCPEPVDRLRSWTIKPSPLRGGQVVLVELQPPLDVPSRTEKPPVLNLQLRDTLQRGLLQPLPAVVPLEASLVQGGLALDWDDALTEAVVTVVPPGSTDKPPREVALPADELPEDGPWGTQLPRHFLSWRGQPIQGTLRVRPRPVQVRTQSRNDITVQGGNVNVSSAVTVEPLSGAVAVIDLRLSTPLPEFARLLKAADVEGPQIVAVERLPVAQPSSAVGLLAPAQPLGLAALLGPQQQGQLWRVRLSRPLRQRESLTLNLETFLLAQPDAAVPLLTVPGGKGEVSLNSAAGQRTVWSHQTDGVALLLPTPGPLDVRAHAVPGSAAVLTQATLTTRVDREGRLTALCGLELRGWGQATFPVRLPMGAQLAALRIDGRDVVLEPRTVEVDNMGTLLELPVPRGADAVHQLEILYDFRGDPCRLLGRLESALPELPLKPLALRRVWRLPACLVPISTDNLLRLPGGSASSSLWSVAERLPRLFALAPRGLAEPWAEQQEQTLRAADRRFRQAAAGQSLTLGEALRRLQPAGPNEPGVTLLVDAAALGEQGLSAESRLALPADDVEGRPALDWLAPLQLVCVPCKIAPLVTTQRQFLAWQRRFADHVEGELPPAIRAALAEALAHGHDASGRFRTVAVWLESPAAVPTATLTAPALETLTPDDELTGWTDWLAVPGAGDVVWVVQARAPIAAGLGLALVFLVLSWRLRQRRALRRDAGYPPTRRLLALLLTWHGVFGLAVLWLPPGLRDLAGWPFLAGVAVALLWYASPPPLRKEQPRLGSTSRKSIVPVMPLAGLLLVLAWGIGTASAPAPQEAIVFLLPGKEEKDTVVVAPQTLLDKLKQRPAPKALAEAVLVEADYQATLTADSSRLEVEATFQIHCTGAGPATLLLPLDGVTFTKLPLLDGVPAVELTAVPGTRFPAVRVRGGGSHKLQASFQVAVARPGEAQFQVPRLAQSKLSLRLPGKARFVQSLVHLGAQRVTEDDKGSLLEVDVGAVTLPGAKRNDTVPVQLRWSNGKAAQAKVTFREAYLWDLGQRGYGLKGVVLFDVGSGEADRLSIDIPAQLVVTSLAVSRGPSRRPRNDNDAGPVRWRDWKLHEPVQGMARLQLDFQTPVRGLVQVRLDCQPRATLFATVRAGATPSTSLHLPVPRPQGTPSEDGYLGYRLGGLKATPGQILRLTGQAKGTFPDFYHDAVGRPEAILDYAGRIHRVGDEGPVLPLTLETLPAKSSSKARLLWRVGATLAEMRATLDLEAADLALVECEVAVGVEVTAVSGPDVRDWSSLPLPGGGRRLQVWLTRTTPRTTLEIRGTTPVARLNVPERRWGALGAPLSVGLQRTLPQAGVFTLLPLRISGLKQSIIEVVAADGLTVLPQSARLLGAGGPFQPRERWRFETEREDYFGRFLVAPAARVPLRLIAFVDTTDRELALRLQFEPLAGTMQGTRVQVRGWPGAAFEMKAPGGRVRFQAGGDRLPTWDIQYAERETRGPTLTGKLPLERLRDWSLPEVEVSGMVCVERWLVLEGAATRLQVRADGASERMTPPLPELEAARKRGARTWQLGAEMGGVRLTDRRGARTAIRILNRENARAVLDERRWTYQTTWWLWHDGPTETNIILPGQTRALSLRVDGKDQPLSRLTATLNGRGAKAVVLRWVEAEAGDVLPTPVAELPRLEGVEIGGSAVHVLALPPGQELTTATNFSAGPTATARAELKRVEVQTRLVDLLLATLSEPLPRGEAAALEEQLKACQERIARRLGNVSRLVATNSPVYAEWQKARERLTEIYQQYRRSPPPETLAAPAAPATQLGHVGTPFYRVEERPSPPAAVGLTPTKSLGTRQAVALSGVLICVLLGVWLTARLTRLTTLARWLWPEQAVLLGAAGWQTFGPTWPVIFLLALGVTARVLILGSLLLSLLQRLWQPRPV